MGNSYTTDELKIILSDGVNSHVTLYQPKSDYSYLLFCLPAMGVRAKFYFTLAQTLSQYNLGVACVGWRGTEKSSGHSPKKFDWGWERLLIDIHEQYLFIKQRFPKKKLVLVGHSLGGQLALLFTARFNPDIEKLVLLATCSPYHVGWSGLNRLKVVMASLLFPLVSSVLGYFPGRKLGFAGIEAKTVIKDWSRVIRTGEFRPQDSIFDHESALSSFDSRAKILSVLFADDFLSPQPANKELLSKLNDRADIDHLMIKAEMLGLTEVNHFNWARKPQHLSKVIKHWILSD